MVTCPNILLVNIFYLDTFATLSRQADYRNLVDTDIVTLQRVGVMAWKGRTGDLSNNWELSGVAAAQLCYDLCLFLTGSNCKVFG